MIHLPNEPRPNPFKPKKGFAFSAYMSRKDVGSGVREFLIVTVGRKYITIFYAPLLLSFKLTHREWADIRVIKPNLTFQAARYCASLAERIEQFTRLNLRFNATIAKQVQSMLNCGEDHGT